VEIAEDRRRRGLARADRVDRDDVRAVDQREQLERQVALRVLAVAGEANREAAVAVEQEADRATVEGLVGAPAKQPVVGVQGQAGAGVVDAGLRDVEVQCRQPLLDQLDERPARPEPDVLVERGDMGWRRA